MSSRSRGSNRKSPTGSAPSYSEVRKRRLDTLIAAVVDLSFGTVWQVREDVWRELLSRYRSDRAWHPGVSIRTKPYHSLDGYVPLLHGTSGKRGPVVVKGLTAREGPGYTTIFGKILRPARVPVKEFISLAPGIPRSDVGEKGWGLDVKRVVRNLDKPKLDPDERLNLWNWAEKKGLL